MATHITYFSTIIPMAWPSVCHLFFRPRRHALLLLTTPFSMTAARIIQFSPYLVSPRAHVTMTDEKCDCQPVPYSIHLCHHSSLARSRYVKSFRRNTDEH